ncbi:hypothetical protein F5Y10DRAFT_276408 [Nemania abortiva]|nr:hypothetical protein F5Y10DRAFT_276408 [Nemania abortiva]
MAQEQTVLPKGIVHNRINVYAEIAQYDVIPVELILRACQVFTTTSRELYDPTARRLENFWTRVLGGDRRSLPGPVIAQLFKDISETSFVKLRGPENRYEPPSPESSASVSPGVQDTPLAPASNPNKETTTPSAKPPHPILKKPRGPSASRPRPTARFVSPPESGVDEDNAKRSETTTPAATAVHNIGLRDAGGPATKEERRQGQPHKSKKKAAAFVASTSSRRRPGISRKSSSQSSAAAAAEVGPKEGDMSQESRYNDLQGPVPAMTEKPERQSAETRKGKENTLSAKAAGKRPMMQPRVERTISKPGIVQNSQTQNEPTRAEQGRTTQSRRGEKVAGAPENYPKTPLPTPIQRNRMQQHSHSESTPLMIRSSSDVGSARPASREVARSLVPPSSLMASTLAKVDTSVIGQAKMAGFTDNIPTAGPSKSLFEDEERDNDAAHETESQTPGGSGLDRRFTPTRPSNSAVIPLARSRSQLAILLSQNPEKKSKR